MPWDAISHVSSGVTLSAFIIAVAAWLYKSHSESRERLIKEAEDENRKELVLNALEVFHVETAGLTKEQQYQIALEQIMARTQRFRTISIVVCFLAVVAGGVSAYAIKKVPGSPDEIEPSPTPDSVLYVLKVKTGTRDKSGTGANITFRVWGERGRSITHTESGTKNKFENGTTTMVHLRPSDDLGEIKKIQVSHDSKGDKSGWYLESILVKNIDNSEEWSFPCGKWLSQSSGGGETSRILKSDGCI